MRTQQEDRPSVTPEVGSSPHQTLILQVYRSLTSQPPELRGRISVVYKPHSVGCFVVADQTGTTGVEGHYCGYLGTLMQSVF